MTALIIIIAVAVVIAAVVIALVARARRHAGLRDRYGSEYDRTVDDAGGKRAAAKELASRKQRHDELEIVPLDPTVAQRYRDEWRLAQERFVDAPADAVASAHDLLQHALADRGYPTRDDDERVAMLSVEHSDVLDRYRTGMDTEQRWRERGDADTEELRQAMQHYRSVFDSVVGEGSVGEAAPADDTYPAETDTPRTTLRSRARNTRR
jgi:hypothetical protein